MRERKSTEKHLEKEDAKAPDVNSLVVRNLLDDFVRIVARCACLASSSSLILRPGTHSCRQSKITETNLKIIVLDKYVLRLDVSMHYALFVNSNERFD